jgi:hypothetical protein
VDALSLLIPVSFAFAVLKHRLMEIELIPRTALVYSLLAVAIGLLYLALVGGLGGAAYRVLGIGPVWIVLITTVIAFALVLPLKKRIETLVGRRSGNARDYASDLRSLDEIRESTGSRDGRAKALTELVQRATRSRAVMLLIRSPAGKLLLPIAKVGLPDETLATVRLPADPFPDRAGSGVIDMEAVGVPDDLKRAARATRSALVIPIFDGGELLGALSVGRTLHGAPFGDEDLDFLTAVAARVGSVFSPADNPRHS